MKIPLVKNEGDFFCFNKIFSYYLYPIEIIARMNGTETKNKTSLREKILFPKRNEK
jgi:hypothetical protein